MKKLLALTLAALVTVLLVGCGSSESAGDDTVKVDASKPSNMSMDAAQGGGTQKTAAPTGTDK